MGMFSVILPAARTNLITNPSFEINTTGWTAVGSGASISRNAEYQRRGAYSCEVTPASGAASGAYFTISLTGGTQYTFSVDVRDVAGQLFRIYFADSAGAVEGIPITWTGTGYWKRKSVTYTPSLTATYRIYVIRDATASTDKFYFDGVQVEAGTETTYFDGDSEDCKWTIEAHSSSSIRPSYSRAGGVVADFETFGFYVSEHLGFGMAGVEHYIQDIGTLPGALITGSKIPMRSFSIVGEIIGSSLADLHDKRKAIIDAVKPDCVRGNQPVTLVYRGVNSERPVHIRAYYEGGLEGEKMTGFTERIAMRFLATDPFWYEDGNSGTLLTVSQSVANANYIIRQTDGVWSALGSGLNNAVRALAVAPNGDLYAGGDFTTAGGITVNNIARWNGTAWSALGSGLNGSPYAMAVAPNGDLYVGGYFTTAGGVTVNRIARWNGTAWSALGGGFNNYVHTLAVAPNGDLYAGGEFTASGGLTIKHVAKWNGSAWSALGNGLNNDVRALAVAPNGDLYAGEQNSVSKWNGTSWSYISTSIGLILRTLAVAPNGDLYAAGHISAGGTYSVIKWNGSIWSALGSGLNGTVCALAVAPNGDLYAGGEFTASGELALTDGVAVWNGTTWAHIPVGLPSSAVVYALYVDDDDLYIGYNTSGTAYSSYVNIIDIHTTAAVRPKIRIKRSGGTSATVAYIKNETTGATIWLNYALQNGEVLTLDFSLVNRSVESDYYGNVIGQAVLRNSDLADFNLLSGENKISAYVIQTGSPTITCELTYPLMHWSCDGSAL